MRRWQSNGLRFAGAYTVGGKHPMHQNAASRSALIACLGRRRHRRGQNPMHQSNSAAPVAWHSQRQYPMNQSARGSSPAAVTAMYPPRRAAVRWRSQTLMYQSNSMAPAARAPERQHPMHQSARGNDPAAGHGHVPAPDGSRALAKPDPHVPEQRHSSGCPRTRATTPHAPERARQRPGSKSRPCTRPGRQQWAGEARTPCTRATARLRLPWHRQRQTPHAPERARSSPAAARQRATAKYQFRTAAVHWRSQNPMHQSNCTALAARASQRQHLMHHATQPPSC